MWFEEIRTFAVGVDGMGERVGDKFSLGGGEAREIDMFFYKRDIK